MQKRHGQQTSPALESMEHSLADSAQEPSPDRRVRRLSRLHVSTAMIMLGLPALSVEAWSQPKVTIDASQATCKGCSLTFTKIATIGSVDDPDFPGTADISSGLTVDSKGRFFATEVGGTKILVYEPNGKYLQSFGQKGEGPGEFVQALKISIGVGDSIHVFSPLRILTFSPQLKFVRSVPTPLEGPQFVEPLVMKGGEFVVPKVPLRNDAAQFLRIRPAREPVGFGTWSGDAIRCSYCSRQIVGRSTTANQFWAMQANAYEIVGWDANDQRVVRHFSVLNSPWFISWGVEAGPGGPLIKPRTSFRELFQDRTGLVWVKGYGAIARWTPIETAPSMSSRLSRGRINIPVGGGKVPSPEVLKRHVSYIDVFDPASGKLYFAQAFIGRQLRMIAPELIGELREDADGIPVWDVFKVAIRRPSQP